ncbi:hypothetical protein ACH429_14945 [Streptomyces pathocidini]|uniref:Uncharacterized protein n=1 Tax=Streptomyces pathocidini TaxID=1650571 RepID=A0ABW7UUF9_9ACTN|nr:hypothetical protein [Streptomyces pathocidini]
MSTLTTERTIARSLMETKLFDRLVATLARDHRMTLPRATRVMDQALAYLATCAQRPVGSPVLSPSPTVDLGWHVFLQYTEPYDRWFASHRWRKVHHHPFDEQGVAYEPASVVIPRTVDAIETAGFAVDEELWAATSLNCSQGGAPKNCGDDGKGGNEPTGC